MTDNDILTYFNQFESNKKINWRKIPNDIAEYLKNRYNDNSTDLLKESYARIKYNIDILPECPTCHKKHIFINRLDVYPYKIYCSNKCKGLNKNWLLKQRETKKEKYGDENYNNREKYKNTCLEKFGVENVYQNENIKNKIKNTKKERYNDEYYHNEDKMHETMLQKYGSETPFQSPLILEKCKQTLKNKYNINNPMELDSVKNKIRQTCLKRYGKLWYTKTDEFKKQAKETMLKKYGVDSYSKTKEFKEHISTIEFQNKRKQKEYITKIKNKSFNSSKEEILCYNLIKEKFSDAIHQYKDNNRYPFNCDIYIPSKDLFIEYQGSEFHGGRPYQGTEEDLNIIKIWQ